MSYELRELTIKDIAPLSRIISKIGVREFAPVLKSEGVMEAFANSSKEVDYSAMVLIVEALGIVLENYDKAEKELLSFLASLAGTTIPKLEAEEPAVLVDLISDVVKQQRFMDFFSRASKLLS